MVKKNNSRKREFITGFILTIVVLLSFFSMNILITYRNQEKNINEKIDVVTQSVYSNISKTLSNIDSMSKTIFLGEDFQIEIDKIYQEENQNETFNNLENIIYKYLSTASSPIIRDVGYIPRNQEGELDVDNLFFYGVNSLFFSNNSENISKLIEGSNKPKTKNGSLYSFEVKHFDQETQQICYARNVYSLRSYDYNELLGVGFVCIDIVKLYEMLNYALVIDGLYVNINNNELSLYSNNASSASYNFNDEKYVNRSMSLEFYDWKLNTYYDNTYIIKSLRADAMNMLFISVAIILTYSILYGLLHKRNLKALNYLFNSFSKERDKATLSLLEYINDYDVDNVIEAYNTMVASVNKLNNDVLYEKDLSLQYQLESKEFQIKSLYSQINKHFIINVLSVVHSLVNLKSVEKANECLENLGDFLRYSLTLKSESTIQDEIKSIEYYLNIQKIRYPNIKTNVVYDVKKHDIVVPKLIIQPLIENAYVHGVLNKVGNIDVYCVEDNKNLTIRVINDGKVISDEKLVTINNKIQYIEENSENNTHGIAVYNIQKRLRLMYGDKATLRILCSDDKKTISYINIDLGD